MTDAFVHIDVEAGDVSGVVREAADLDAVSAAHTVTGEFDVIAQLDLESKEDIPRVVADQVHAIDGVADTVTNVAFEP